MGKDKQKIISNEIKKQNWFRLVSAIVICEAAGIIGSVFTTPAIDGWYSGLLKPSFNPPSWIFAPVWTTLFVLMGISLYLIWQKGLEKRENKLAFWLFIIHLGFNTLWSILFFGLKNPGWAFLEIVILWLFIVYLVLDFCNIDKKAAYLLLPYLLWVSFASVLNYSIWQLNL
jgi:tryptophan-rich sensory protein